MTEIEKTISKQIDMYYSLAEQHNNNIDTWLGLGQGLSANLYRLTEIYETDLSDFARSKHQHKQKFLKSFLSKKAQKIEDKTITDKLADTYARDESLSEWSNELFAEARREAVKEKIGAIKTILSSIQQTIAHLRYELEQTKKTQT